MTILSSRFKPQASENLRHDLSICRGSRFDTLNEMVANMQREHGRASGHANSAHDSMPRGRLASARPPSHHRDEYDTQTRLEMPILTTKGQQSSMTFRIVGDMVLLKRAMLLVCVGNGYPGLVR